MPETGSGLSPLRLEILPDLIAICRLAPGEPVPVWATQGPFWAVARTPEELSVVCPQASLPLNTRHYPDWRALKVIGPLDPSVIGILATLSRTLAKAGVSLFALSTFDTDYLLVPEAGLPTAIQALQAAGHTIAPEPPGP